MHNLVRYIFIGNYSQVEIDGYVCIEGKEYSFWAWVEDGRWNAILDCRMPSKDVVTEEVEEYLNDVYSSRR